jgi:hypothetical protein
MANISQAQKRKERYRLEGALGYTLRIAQKVEDKATVEEISKLVQSDFERISASLSRHLKEDLMFAGFEVGLFEDHLTQSNKQEKN